MLYVPMTFDFAFVVGLARTALEVAAGGWRYRRGFPRAIPYRAFDEAVSRFCGISEFAARVRCHPTICIDFALGEYGEWVVGVKHWTEERHDCGDGWE